MNIPGYKFDLRILVAPEIADVSNAQLCPEASPHNLVQLIICASNQINRKYDELLKEFGITYHYYLVLKLYQAKSPASISVAYVAKYMSDHYQIFLDAPRKIKALTDMGLVIPSKFTEFGKVRGSTLSPKGSEFLALIAQKIELEKAVSESVSETEVNVLNDLLMKVVKGKDEYKPARKE